MSENIWIMFVCNEAVGDRCMHSWPNELQESLLKFPGTYARGKIKLPSYYLCIKTHYNKCCVCAAQAA